MAKSKFYDIIESAKITSCSSCLSYAYTLPFPIDAEIGPALLPLGSLKYALEKYKLVKIDNDLFTISSRLGSNRITIKFKKDFASNKNLFETHLAAYAELKLGLEIEL